VRTEYGSGVAAGGGLRRKNAQLAAGKGLKPDPWRAT
jgi:hypothetical protein